MKKRYAFLSENLKRFSLLIAFAASFSIDLQAQTTAPGIQWDKTFGGNDRDELRCLQQTTDGGYILGGLSLSGNNGDKTQPSKGNIDYWVVKVDAAGNKVWDKTYGGSGKDELYSLQQTSDGGYILGGSSTSGISGDKTGANKGIGTDDLWVIKLDGNGNKQWDKTYGGNYYDFLSVVQQTSDGGYILGGSSMSGISADKTGANKGFDTNDFWIVKVDGNGNKQWDKTYGGNDHDVLVALQQTSDGGYILGGFTLSGNNGDKTQASRGNVDIWVVKLDGNGNKQWDKTLGGNSVDDLGSLQQTPDGGFILGGSSFSDISGDKTEASKGHLDFWVVKLNASGSKMWDKTLGGDNLDRLHSLQIMPDGSAILGGYSGSNISADKTEANKGGYDFWLVKISSTGNKLWDKTIGGNWHDELLSLKLTTDGGFILGGYSSSPVSGDKSQASRGDNDFWVVKLGPNALSTNETKPTFALSLSPNPSHGKFNLHLSGLTAPNAEVTITDLLGRVVLQQQFKAINAQLSEEINLLAAKGMYLLQVKAGDQITTRKIVVE